MIRSTLSVTKHTPSARALVAAEHPLGAEVGAGILARGGNAVDAAVATAFAMTVVEPFMSSVAGGGTMLVHLAKRGETVALDFNVRGARGLPRDAATSWRGGGPGALPLAARGGRRQQVRPEVGGDPGLGGRALSRARALRHHGPGRRRGSRDRAGREGLRGRTGTSRSTSRRTADELARLPGDRAHLPARRPLRAPAGLARPRRRAAPARSRAQPAAHRQGRAGRFYRGAIAQAIDEEMRRTGGFLRATDLAGYAPRVLEPLMAKYRRLDLAFSPGATGGPTAVEMLNILAQFPAAKVGYETPGGLHLRAEAVRYAFLDRLRHLGDPLAVRAPWRGLGFARARGASWPRACGPPARAATPSCPTRGPTTRGGRPRPRPTAGGEAAGAGSPPTAATAPRTSARWTASATWSR